MEHLLKEIKEDKRKKLKKYKEKFKMTLKDWMHYHHSEIVMNKCYYMGIQTLKNPMDVWIYQEIIHEIKPDFIIEIGCMYGGSTLYFANLLDVIGKGKVISVDIQRDYYEVKHERIIEITGDSASPDVINQVYSLCKDKSVLVIHDGDHSKVQVLKDLRAYADLVSLNSYFIIEDTANEFMTENESSEGPFEAVETFLKENSDFTVDKECERYILTYAMNGFLKKIKNSNNNLHNNAKDKKSGVQIKLDDMKPYLVPGYHTRLLSNYLKSNIDRVDSECMDELYKISFEMYNLFKDLIKYDVNKLNLTGVTAIYGSGDLCEGLVTSLKDYENIKLTAIIEQNKNKWVSHLFGFPIISIDELEEYKIENIIIGSISCRNEIFKRLENIKSEKHVNIYKLPNELIQAGELNSGVTGELLNTCPIISEIMMGKNQLRVILGMLEKILKENIEGDIVELGCNSGSTSLFIRRLLNIFNSDKKYHVYDSFEGLPEKSEQDVAKGNIQRHKGECQTTKDVFKNNFKEANLDCPVINEGWFKEIPDEKYPDKISFAFLDGDFYSSIIDSFNKIYNKLSKDAVVCIHDYGNVNLPGSRKACNDFFKDKPEKVFELNGVGYLIKA